MNDDQDKPKPELDAATSAVARADLLGNHLPSSLRLINYPGTFSPEASEVLDRSAKELDRQRELLEWAWSIIANASGGDWSKQSGEWQEAAGKWRDSFHS